MQPLNHGIHIEHEHVLNYPYATLVLKDQLWIYVQT